MSDNNLSVRRVTTDVTGEENIHLKKKVFKKVESCFLFRVGGARGDSANDFSSCHLEEDMYSVSLRFSMYLFTFSWRLLLHKTVQFLHQHKSECSHHLHRLEVLALDCVQSNYMLSTQ